MALLVAVAGSCCGFLVLWHVGHCRRPAPAGDVAGRVSVIIPARNEAETLPVLLTSLCQQSTPAGEILVVDDASTDDTAAVAQRHGVRVVDPGPLPPGWRGKAWACHRGAAQATGDVLVFLDADTRLHPAGLGRLRAAVAAGGAAVSVCPYQYVPRPYEQLSAFFVLMMAAGVGAFAAPGLRRRSGLFGPCLALSREAYRGAGGHKAVKSRTLENLYLSRRLRAAGTPIRCCGGRGLLDVRMYPHGVRELAAGWSKAFVSGALATPPPILALATGWLCAAALAALMLIIELATRDAAHAVWWTGAYGCVAAQIGFQLKRLGSFQWYASACYPVPLVFYMVVFGAAAVKRLLGVRTEWQGRAIDG